MSSPEPEPEPDALSPGPDDVVDAQLTAAEDQVGAEVATQLTRMRLMADDPPGFLAGMAAGVDLFLDTMFTAKARHGFDDADEQLEAERVVLAAILNHLDREGVSRPWPRFYPE